MTIEAGEAEQRLALGDPELRLPWLESADETIDEGLDWGRIGKFAAIVAIILLAFAAIAIAASEWASVPPEGDGSLIEAPDAPYKVRPMERGGMTVAGTGDSSYEVGQGFDNESRLADRGPAPMPTPSTSATPATEPEPPLSGVAVQIGAYASDAAAQKGWDVLRQRYEPLGSYDRRIVQGRADIGVVYRLQAVVATTASAFALCDDMRRHGIECQVKR